ncbi:adenosylcobinamide amidohydrolase [Lentibacillus sp. JNUCC-1]|uniref:adenosylcobinamide amidohydrolase n=1 Tax=Lentibacillus sp. JNUCC-1 TaxID=2654513 RepID=UPI0012E932EB|nr:adenosylcobinamide amidohydrolase [Lentibacillus sp. JNUCC-1]
MIEMKHVSGGYGSEPVVKDITFEIKSQEFFGIIGPNGSGKTTLAKLMSALLPVQSGTIHAAGKALEDYSAKELARLMAVLPQHSSQTFSYTVYETVSLGRYAHQKGLFGSFTAEDEQIVQEVMQQTGISVYQDAKLDQLSGGERQRVYLAQALAQNPSILLLDEPTNHLDLAYQKDLLDLLKRWTKEKELTVIAIFHDLNLAGLYCDRLLLLEKGYDYVCDTPDEVLKKERLERVYETTIEKNPHPKVPKPQIMLVPELLPDQIETERVDARRLEREDDMMLLTSETPLKTMSSSVIGAGMGWYKNFINRRVPANYDCTDHKAEMEEFIAHKGLDPNDTAGMMTAVNLEDAAEVFLEGDGFSIYVVVTAGSGTALDVTRGEQHAEITRPGTINTWVFVNGYVLDEAFIQAIVTATEAKTKALQRLSITDPYSGTSATGTATDSFLIAATQQGDVLQFAGPITPLGILIAKGVYTCTLKALDSYQKRNNGGI